MKILWIVNTIFPEAAEYLKLPPTVYGGWMHGLANEMVKVDSIELTIATVYNGNELIDFKINEKFFFLLPRKKGKVVIKDYWKEIKNKVRPDLVHIHGTEFNHGLLYVEANSNENVIFSIQGLVSIYARYYLAGLKLTDIIKNISIRDLLQMDNLLQQQTKFLKRGKYEREYFKLCKYVIGRTDWDESHSFALNENIKYFFCNEMLRDFFYNSDKWDYEKCNKNTIFLSQAGYPIKGLHQVIKAVYLLKNKGLDIQIRVGGYNILDESNLIAKFSRGGYSLYIKRMIKKYKLQKNIIFLGNLNAQEMFKEYKMCNLFICPSSIENSPNSIGEAQLLGVPVISSYVGGTSNMIKDSFDGFLYRFEEVEMLAYLIYKSINNSELLNMVSQNAIRTATKRHSKADIMANMLTIYKEMV